MPVTEVKETNESRWFKLVVLIGSGLGTAFFIANAVFYDRIKTGSCSAITQREADTMFTINIILAIIFGILFVWSLFRLFTQKDYRVNLQQKTSDFLTTTSGGYYPTKMA